MRHLHLALEQILATATLAAMGCGDTGHDKTADEYLRDKPSSKRTIAHLTWNLTHLLDTDAP